MVELVSMVGDVIGSLPETLEPARWRLLCAASREVLGRAWLVWLICGDDAGDTDSLGGCLACWCMMG